MSARSFKVSSYENGRSMGGKIMCTCDDRNELAAYSDAWKDMV